MSLKPFYPVAIPILNGNEKKYVMDCMDSTWISSNGSYISRFEQAFADFSNAKHAISINNGTSALHLSLLAHDITEDCEIIVPTLTFVATANAVRYCGAKPIFVDCDPYTWNIDPTLIEKKITNRTRGIIVVHLYGNPCDMDPIYKVAKKHGLFIIEDAAEAIGAEFNGKLTGTLGDIAAFSLFGNKIITTGEGGMITTNDDSLAEKVRILKGQGMDSNKRYWHPIIGYNYRMTNIQAAIGLAQIENVHWHVTRRIEVGNLYLKYLRKENRLILPTTKPDVTNVFWMFSVVLKKGGEKERNNLMAYLLSKGIETRPFFYPIHKLPPYMPGQNTNEYPNATSISERGINLPSHAGLSEEDIQYLCQCVQEGLDLLGS